MKAAHAHSRAAKTALLLLLVIQLSAACRQPASNSNSNNSNAPLETYDEPPFQTREPDRYQAIIVTTSSLKSAQQSSSTEQRSFVARDGERRRTEIELRAGVKLIMLDIPAGHFILSPSRSAYADLSESTQLAPPQANGDNLPREFSPEILNNEARGRARYERLGVEDVDGRKATKYRVTIVNEAGSSQGAETLIWVDESLGMPVRSETVSRSTEGGEAQFTMQMLDIKQETDASLFEIPANYRKQSLRDLYNSLASGGENSGTNQR